MRLTRGLRAKYAAMMFACTLLLLSNLPTHAQILITLTQPGPVTAGSSVVFAANLLNQGNTDFVFDAISFNYVTPADEYLTANADPFYDGTVPDFLSAVNVPPTNSYNGPLFSIMVSPDAPIGNYNGYVTITGHSPNNGSYDTVQAFRVTVAPSMSVVPEMPAEVSSVLLLFSLGIMIMRVQRRAKRAVLAQQGTE